MSYLDHLLMADAMKECSYLPMQKAKPGTNLFDLAKENLITYIQDCYPKLSFEVNNDDGRLVVVVPKEFKEDEITLLSLIQKFRKNLIDAELSAFNRLYGGASAVYTRVS